MPAIGTAHWEGFEAADPSTPAAVLRFESAVTRYSELNTGPLPWRELFDGAGDSAGDDDAHGGHEGAPPPATTQQ